MLDRILVAIDTSRESIRALRMAIELCRKSGADLKAVAVQKPVPSWFSYAVFAWVAENWRRTQRESCKALQALARQQMSRAGIYPDAEMVTGEEVHAIVQSAARYKADLVVMARRRTIRLDRKVEDVADRARCAVLSVQ